MELTGYSMEPGLKPAHLEPGAAWTNLADGITYVGQVNTEDLIEIKHAPGNDPGEYV